MQVGFKGFLIVMAGVCLCGTLGNANADTVTVVQESDNVLISAKKEIQKSSDNAKKDINKVLSDAERKIDEAMSAAKQQAPEPVQDALEDVHDAMREALDDAEEILDDNRDDAMDELEDARKDCFDAVQESQKENHPSSGMLTFHMLKFDMDPFKDLVAREKELVGKQFDFDDNLVPFIGGIGYHDIGNGARVGMGLWGGYKRYTSNIYHTIDSLGNTRDSTITLRIIPVYLGFNFEKAFIFSRFSLLAGGMIGGGSHIVYKQNEDRTNPSVFYSTDNNDNSDEQNGSGSWAFAPFVAWDVHGGFTVALAPVFHVGVEGYALFTYAYEGFGPGFGDFMTVNPGVRIRFMFGKQGKQV